ncbi:MAG: hypothetical protein ACQES8_09020, partial [Thermodesulfobacteriota bacterium]
MAGTIRSLPDTGHNVDATPGKAGNNCRKTNRMLIKINLIFLFLPAHGGIVGITTGCPHIWLIRLYLLRMLRLLGVWREILFYP